MVYEGCSTSGDGDGGDGGDGGDAPTAISFDGETSVPATGGAALATSYSNGLSSIISSMLNALAVDASSEFATKSLKFLDDLELGICTTGGMAVLNAPGAGGSGGSGTGGSGGSGTGGGSGGSAVDLGDVFLTLTDCAGSPLSSTAINGIIQLKGTTLDLELLGAGGSGGSGVATATMAATAEIAALRIAPSTVLAGEFAVAADIVLSSLLPPEVESIDQILGDLRFPDEDLITVDEDGRRALEFGCFQVVTGIRTDPPAIDPFQPRGVLLLEGRVYTLNSFDADYTVPTIGFDLSGVTAVPVSGDLELYSGDQPDCGLWGEGIDGNTSKVTATFRRAETVPVVDIRAEDPDGSIYECTEEWENLLQTLRDIAFDSCPCVAICGTGGAGGSGGSGSGGSVGVEYCASYTPVSHACDVAPTFGEAVLVNIDGSAMTYTMNAGPFSNDVFASAFDVSATGTWDGTTGAGTGEFVEDPNWPRPGNHPQGCAAPQARLTFDLTFASGLAEFSGLVSFDVMLDANCGSSMCFASATVMTATRGPCP